MLAAVFCVLFGLSLLPGRKPLCLKFAERISNGIMPEGAIEYCLRLTWVWFFILLALTVSNLVCFVVAMDEPRWGWAIRLAPSVYAIIIIPLVFLIEGRVRRRRFEVVFHTSGSTGKSKTIIKPFETLAKEVAMHRAYYRARFPKLNPKDLVFLGTVQWDHMLGKLWMDMLPKAMGVEADSEVIGAPEVLIAKMRLSKRVFLVTTPSFLERFTIYADQYEVPKNCIEIVTSGARLKPEVAERAERIFGVRPRQIFGSTETGGVAWMREREIAEVFEPVKVEVVDGRLLVKSPFSFRRKYLMGDGVELAPDKRSFKLLGRMDRLVKINEERVNLAEMETKVVALGFKEAALVKLEGERGAYLGLVVAGEAKPSLEMRKLLLPVFPRGTVPRKFRFVSEIPKNPQGKVLASEIVQMF